MCPLTLGVDFKKNLRVSLKRKFLNPPLRSTCWCGGGRPVTKQPEERGASWARTRRPGDKRFYVSSTVKSLGKQCVLAKEAEVKWGNVTEQASCSQACGTLCVAHGCWGWWWSWNSSESLHGRIQTQYPQSQPVSPHLRGLWPLQLLTTLNIAI